MNIFFFRPPRGRFISRALNTVSVIFILLQIFYLFYSISISSFPPLPSPFAFFPIYPPFCLSTPFLLIFIFSLLAREWISPKVLLLLFPPSQFVSFLFFIFRSPVWVSFPFIFFFSFSPRMDFAQSCSLDCRKFVNSLCHRPPGEIILGQRRVSRDPHRQCGRLHFLLDLYQTLEVFFFFFSFCIHPFSLHFISHFLISFFLHSFAFSFHYPSFLLPSFLAPLLNVLFQ